MALGFNIINQKINLTGFQQQEQTDIRAAIKLAYEHSKIASDMFDDWINNNKGQTIGISYVQDEAAYRNSTKQVEIDPSYIKKLSYINTSGIPVSVSLVGALMHELGHALKRKSDPSLISDQATEYKGTNLPFVNTIWRQLGLQPMLSYFGTGSSNPNDLGYQKLGYNYAKGNPITDAVNVQYLLRKKSADAQDWSTANLSDKLSNVLLIGGETANKLTGGNGNDVFFGGGENDILDGGGGTNTAVYFGKSSDYGISRQFGIFGGPISGITDINDKYNAGTDQLRNIQYVQFDDFRVHVDSNILIFDVATGLTPDINPDVNFYQLPTNDFNDDGNSDILWRNIDGRVAIWSLDGTVATPQSVGSLTPDWTIAGTGDFNGDLSDDILWRNADGTVATWQLNDSTKTTSVVLGTAGVDWTIAGTGDFNGDSESDILWRNDDGRVALWQINNSAYTTGVPLGTVGVDWKIAGAADFNDDGESDILWRNDDGRVALWQINNSAYTTGAVIGTVTLDWKIEGTGDFNGDGKADILWRNDNGTVALWQMDGTTIINGNGNGEVISTLSTDWKIDGTGDFNDDGKADILWRNDLGSVATWQMNGSSVILASLTSISYADNSWKIAAPIL